MSSRKILFVDDDPNLLAAFQRNYRHTFSFDTAVGGEEALALLQTSGPYALVLADMNMPGMKGIELLERIRELSPDTIRMMLTGNADQQTATDAVNRGEVYRFLNKPCPPEILIPSLEAGLKHYAITQMERELLEGTLTGSIKMLTDILGMVAPEALGRGQRLRDSMTRFARHLKMTDLWELELGALLSSIGYAAIPPSVLQKIAALHPLTPDETNIVRRAPQLGHDLLADIPRLSGVAQIVLFQTKHFDGYGFPEGPTAGPTIPLGARLLKILHDRLVLELDGVVKQRAYIEMKGRPGFYDPCLLDQCFQCFADFLVASISAERPVEPLPLAKLLPGDIVVSDIQTKGGLALVNAGSTLTAMMIARLTNFVELGDLREPFLIQRPSRTA